MPDSQNVNFFQAMMNPQFASQQLQIQRQQALAQQMMDEGSQQPSTAQLANPGGQVVSNSPWAAAGRALEKGLGGYMQGKALADQMQSYQGLHDQMSAPQNSQALANGIMGNNGASDPMSDPYAMIDPATALKAHFDRMNAAPIKAAETANTPYITPQGTYTMGSQLMGQQKPQASLPMRRASNPVSVDETPAAPVILSRNGQDIDQASPAMASDGKPFLPNVIKIPPADPSGTPKFKTENTKTGVEQTMQDQKDAAEGNKAFATTAQSLGQEAARLDNLIKVYKDVQSGTLTAQNPELFNRLAALGFHDDPNSIKDLAGIQNATQNHILQVIQQIKDTNANAGGGAPTRVFGSEISQLLENGESTKGQPEALWNVIGQAKGVVDHHLDMVNGWQKAGGLGNRLAGGYTMRPDDFAQQFSTNHNIVDYRDKALKEMGPFKGMAGNDGSTSSSNIKTINGVTYTKINGVWHQ